MSKLDDRQHMTHALRLAARGLGRVWPNPAVGCVILDAGGKLVGEGWTQPGGRPHAETEALGMAGAAARGATVYVTLEPCAHYGKTPPCAEALIAAGVARVVVAITDPDPRVDGGGIRLLEQAGIAVEIGVLAAEARALNAGFLKRVTAGLPLVTLKLATSLDGRIATRSGESQWITGPEARARGHLLRADHDAIMIGRGTAEADNPELSCRLPGLEERSPVRVVLDGGLSTPERLTLYQTARRLPTWVLTSRGLDDPRARALGELGVVVEPCAPGIGGGVDLQEVLRTLAKRGITRVLIEGGARLATAALKSGLVDRLVWFRSGLVLGGDGRAGIDSLDVDQLATACRFRRVDHVAAGEDMMEIYLPG
ncbi:bifunctional diaminohydroxyphosphoribosylaminopyrimidine deaminase/5-amino-6-(5-phosphoribosylamino)uracil reductase RibD [Govanella unica]|uniref:Riboflavin biosynthesis protein RibD n=1 Tax=Govanella unica TaxID=2975056 RepID=A0A9X3Z7E4_9PROT|nr:bifunctional diaminohydroxyphosphoribosylaminopyrimidine deaminase/5-amino-6-(5-phosphoribosylamino)uracil reductase RibD [Govania unica]MDA5194086.1 bifunctional diaminohydroxyphosphoribosylaminopyrimidine deaminase/5-amino-6-(5-phosphoribosylamino)uracil reductase RibD [Govania unica]